MTNESFMLECLESTGSRTMNDRALPATFTRWKQAGKSLGFQTLRVRRQLGCLRRRRSFGK